MRLTFKGVKLLCSPCHYSQYSMRLLHFRYTGSYNYGSYGKSKDHGKCWVWELSFLWPKSDFCATKDIGNVEFRASVDSSLSQTSLK